MGAVARGWSMSPLTVTTLTSQFCDKIPRWPLTLSVKSVAWPLTCHTTRPNDLPNSGFNAMGWLHHATDIDDSCSCSRSSKVPSAVTATA